MKALRSSPFLPVSLASALQVFILFCWVSFLLALRQSFMKALRSSPFLPSASLLQVAILLCWGVFSAGAGSAACAQPEANAKPKARTVKP